MLTRDIFEQGINMAKKFSFIPRQNFPDSGIVFESPDRKNVAKIALGIDVGTAELLYAKQQGCDLVIAHHPIGAPLMGMADEVSFQTKNLGFYGVPEKSVFSKIEEGAQKERRRAAAYNISNEATLAKNLDLDLMILHTPMDIIGIKIMQNVLEKEHCDTLADCLNILATLGEFSLAAKFGQKPFIAHGDPTSKIGKISFSEFLGAEEGSKEIFQPLKNAGIDTLLVPHFSEDFFRSTVAADLQIIYCGHMASDSIGPNAFLDTLLTEKSDLEILPLGGFLRTAPQK
ncbi:MAG: Nif3-like dinuclear metal center hexameric protein [Parcubacteria group bacterium]